MKVMLLGPGGSIHTTRWANGLAGRGVDVHLVTVHRISHDLDPRVKVHRLGVKGALGYIFAARGLRDLMDGVQPDLVNAHYASGYGLLARLARCRPLLLSVWGSDVYEFPGRSWFHQWILRRNLEYATAVASTCRCMAQEVRQIFSHDRIFITPFGIDEDEFQPQKVSTHGPFVIGTVKTLAPRYGIDILLKAFALVRKRLPTEDIRLEISGGGPDVGKLKKLAKQLEIDESVQFHGVIRHQDVPLMLNRMNVYCALSRAESFGVAILEANACGKPVVVSDADGLKEVTQDGSTGFVVPKDNPGAASEAIARLALNSALRHRMGLEARAHVLENYTWRHSLDSMLNAYYQTIAASKEERRSSGD